MQRIHAFVKGKVQGVYFRAHTKKFADEHNIKGWVKNLEDGGVEVVAEGEKDQVQKMVQFLQNGSPEARVDSVEIKNEKPVEVFKGFSIRYL
jgi:acylphosphatase